MGEKVKIQVKRDTKGLIVTVEAPRVAKLVHDYCIQSLGVQSAKDNDSQHGEIYKSCNVVGDNPNASLTALASIFHLCPFDYPIFEGMDSDPAPNLYFMRALKAAQGPITHRFKGLYPFEICEKYRLSAEKVIKTVYQEFSRVYDKTTVIAIEPEPPSLNEALRQGADDVPF